MNNNKIGNFIKELRTEKNWSQEELAAKLYISRQSVSKWEIGQTTPSMSIMIKLAEIFELTLPEILEGERATKDNIDVINSNTTKEIIKIHKKFKKVSHISTIIISILIFVFLGYYFLTSYKSQNIYEVTGTSNNFTINNGLFIITKSNVYFTIQNIQPSENIEELTLYYLDDNNARHNIYSKSGKNNIFISDIKGINEYFDVKNKSQYIKNMYLEVKSKKFTEDIKLNLRKIYENNEILNFNNDVSSKENSNEIDNVKLIENIKTKFEKNNDIYEKLIKSNKFQIEINYNNETNYMTIFKYTDEFESHWTYNLDSSILKYEKLDAKSYETIEQNEANIKNDQNFVKEFISIINEYVN